MGDMPLVSFNKLFDYSCQGYLHSKDYSSLKPFCGVLGRKGIDEVLRTKACPITISSSTFLRLLYSWSLALECGESLSFLDFVDESIHESLRA